MRNKFLTIVTVIITITLSAFALPTLPQRRDMVGAYYYPWYDSAKWAGTQAELTPLLGQYSGGDSNIVAQHIDTASYYGIDVFFMSWWGKTDLTDQQLRSGFLKAPNNNKMKFAMLVEPLGLLDSLDGAQDGVVDFDSARVVQAWINIFEYFHDNFWSLPSYFKINGRPVVLVYVTRTFKNFGPQYIDSLQAHVGDVYIMADEAFLGTQADPTTARNGLRNGVSVFDSYVSYNAYEPTDIIAGDSALSYQTRIAMPYYQNWAAKTVFHPPLMPYYHDFRAGHPPLPGSVPQFRTIIQNIRSLPVTVPATDSLNRVYLVTSWNEWFEGTAIEPSVENGDQYCKVLRQAFVEQGTHSRPEPVQIASTTTLRIKSVAKNAYLCMERIGKGNVSVRNGCNPAGQPITFVDLGNNQVALKDPATGNYLSVYSDSLLYPLQNVIGTWEIFRLSQQGNNIALQSKKNNAWLKPSADTSLSIAAAGQSLDSSSLFFLDTSPVSIARNSFQKEIGLANPAYRYSVSFFGDELRVSSPQKDEVSITVMDMQGRALISDEFSGSGVYALGRLKQNGMHILVIRSNGGIQKELIAKMW